MKFLTSYFSNAKNLPQGAVPISIALYPPKNKLTGVAYFREYKRLAPPKSLLLGWKSGAINRDEDYVDIYTKNIIQKLDVGLVVADLRELSKGADVVMLCYETPGDLCHRHLVSEWLRENGVEALEYQQKIQKQLTLRM